MKTKMLHVITALLFLGMVQSCCTPSATIGSVNNTLRPQETDNWCWAAVTQMMAENEGISISQCDLANHRFSKTNCCNFQNEGQSCPKTNDCNEPGWLELDFAGVNFSESATAQTYAKIKSNIYCGKNVMGYAYGTSGVVGHVVAVRGYVTVGNTNYVVLNDPWAPCHGSERLLTYEEYADPSGTATHWNTWYDTSKK